MVTKDKPNRSPAAPAQPPEHAAVAPRGTPTAGGDTSGRVQFDDRGNAVWEWSIATGAFGREVSTERLQRLEHPALSLVDDSPPAAAAVKVNPLGTKKGYDPYDSGKLGKPKEKPKKTDLRKLGDWLKLRKQAADIKQGGG